LNSSVAEALVDLVEDVGVDACLVARELANVGAANVVEKGRSEPGSVKLVGKIALEKCVLGVKVA
jgi:hypothetical protein